MTRIPKFSELQARRDAPAGSSWGLFGPKDELGTINFLTPERILEAKSCIRHGRYFNLDCALDAFNPPILAHRKTLEHSIFGSSPYHRDDRIDSFYLQSGTQLDGLRHFAHPLHGYYNGHAKDAIVAGSPTLGINRVAEHGIVGRGVLIDIERSLEKQGRQLDYASGEPIDADLVEAAARHQGVAFKSGDILLLRTGWLKYYFELSPEQRSALPNAMCSPGLVQSYRTIEWIWDRQFSVCACDNFGLECFPPSPDSPFSQEVRGVDDVHPRHAGMMHTSLIALLGLTIGEQWNLEELAADCAEDQVWECFVSAKPLNLVGGVGSPANAWALK